MSWIENYNLNVFTPHEMRETQAIAIKFTQHPTAEAEHDDEEAIIIPRLPNKDVRNVKLSNISAVEFQHYHRIRQPLLPVLHRYNGQTLLIIDQQS